MTNHTGPAQQCCVPSFIPQTSHQLPPRTSKDKSLMGLKLDQEQEEETKTVTAMV